MPSPFPGMDPYVEAYKWLPLHHQLSSEIVRQLAPSLRPKYVISPAERLVFDEFEGVSVARTGFYPVVEVLHAGGNLELDKGTATIIAPLTLPTVVPEEVPHVSIEIRQTLNQELVTAIEILSLSNKRSRGREQYLEKRRQLLRSRVHLIEIDLLAEGARVPMQKPLPQARYFIFVSRANNRPNTEIWPLQLMNPLPDVPIPLLRGDPDARLKLGMAFDNVYDTLGWDLSFDYALDPETPLAPEELKWMHERLSEAGLCG